MVKIETTSVFSSRVRIRKLASSLNLTSIEAAILQKISKPLGFFFFFVVVVVGFFYF